MYKKQDDEFDEMAADPARRRAGIADYSKRRTLMYWCAMVVMVCAIVAMLLGEKWATMGVFCAAFSWSAFTKMDCDLRLLRVTERLQKGKDEKPTA